jgi:hypothetical protein
MFVITSAGSSSYGCRSSSGSGGGCSSGLLSLLLETSHEQQLV